jgi:predicted DsbA family dithiol-disulfide isomerase
MVEVVWRAFELHPEPVPTLDPKGDYLQSAWKSSVYPLAERLGVKMRLPPLERREFEQGVLEDERTAEALGLRGVPAFVADRKATLSGVQPVDSL